MVRYLQSRLNDLRDENLTLRERLKSSNYLQQQNAIHNHHLQQQHQQQPPTIPPLSSSLHHQLNNTKTYSDNNEYANMNASICSGTYLNLQDNRINSNINNNNNNLAVSLADDDCASTSLYTQSVDGDDRLESRNELLQQKLEELQKLQIQLNNVQS